MKILYIHGDFEKGDGRECKMIKSELNKRGIRYTLDAPDFPVCEPKIMNKMLTGLMENRQYDCLIASSLGAFYALAVKCAARILINPTLPDNLKFVRNNGVNNNSALTEQFSQQLQSFQNYYFDIVHNSKMISNTYFVFGKRDNVAGNEEFFKQYFNNDDNVFRIEMEHSLNKTGAKKVCDIIEDLIEKQTVNNRNTVEALLLNQWSNDTVLDVPIDEFVKQNADKTLAQVLGEAPYAYAYYDISCLELSVASYNCYSRNMNSPLFCYNPDLCLTIGDLLSLTVKQLFEMKNLKRANFAEIITKTSAWLKEIKNEIK